MFLILISKLTGADCHRLPYKVEKIDISKNVQKEPYAP